MSLVKKKAIFSVIILILMVGAIALFVNANRAEETLTLDRTIQAIHYEDTTAYIDCVDDPMNYVFYEFDAVTVDCLKGVESGDAVRLVVSEDYQNFKYAVVHQMWTEGELLFDSMEHDRQHDQNISVVFLTIGLVSLLTALIILLLKKQPTPNKDGEFSIKPPEWNRNVLLICIAGGFAGFVPFWVLFWLGVMEYKTVSFSYIFFIFVILGSVGLSVYFNEAFLLSNGEYVYRAPFRRKKRVAVHEVGFVEIKSPKNGLVITFFDKNEGELLRFRDNGQFVRNGELIRSLAYYKISREIELPYLDIEQIEPILKKQLEDYGRSMLFLWLRGEKYTIHYEENGCEISRATQDGYETRWFPTIEALCVSPGIQGIVLKREWQNVERLTIFA